MVAGGLGRPRETRVLETMALGSGDMGKGWRCERQNPCPAGLRAAGEAGTRFCCLVFPQPPFFMPPVT